MLSLLSSMAPREVLAEAAALYAAHYSVSVTTQAAGGVEVARRIAAGEAFDMVVLASDAIAKLVAAEKLLEQGRADLMTSGIAIAVRSGSTHPDISDAAAVRQAVLAAESFSYSTGPSGTYLEGLFSRWGILPMFRERLIVPPPGVPIARLIAEGRVALGFQQTSELIGVPGVDVLGPMPAAVQLATTFSAAIAPGCRDRNTAERFLNFVASSATDAIKHSCGMLACARLETHA